jgi:hypothetical protein
MWTTQPRRGSVLGVVLPDIDDSHDRAALDTRTWHFLILVATVL